MPLHCSFGITLPALVCVASLRATLSVPFFQSQHFSVSLVKAFPSFRYRIAKALARFCCVYPGNLAITLSGQISLVHQLIDKTGNRRRCQMKLLTQFFLANTRIIIDQHHEEGMRRRQSCSAKFLFGHTGDDTR